MGRNCGTMAETIRERQRRRTSKYGTKRNQTVRLNVNYNIQMFTKFCEYALSENQMIGVTGLENLLKVLKASEVKHFSENESMMLRYLFLSSFKCDLGALSIYRWIVLTNIDILLKVAGRFVFQKCNQTKC